MDNKALQNLQQLEAVLTQAVDRQRQMLSLLERKRDAMRQGKAQEMTDLCRLEGALVQAVGDLEKRRLNLVADLTLALAPEAQEPLKMLDLAQRLAEPHRGRLLVLRTQLVTAMQAVQDQTRVVRRASETLVKHVNGLIRTIGTVSRGGTYGQAGTANIQPARLSTINFTA